MLLPLPLLSDGPRPYCSLAGTCDRHKGDPRNPVPSYQPMHKQGAIVLATGGGEHNPSQLSEGCAPHTGGALRSRQLQLCARELLRGHYGDRQYDGRDG